MHAKRWLLIRQLPKFFPKEFRKIKSRSIILFLPSCTIIRLAQTHVCPLFRNFAASCNNLRSIVNRLQWKENNNHKRKLLNNWTKSSAIASIFNSHKLNSLQMQPTKMVYNYWMNYSFLNIQSSTCASHRICLSIQGPLLLPVNKATSKENNKSPCPSNKRTGQTSSLIMTSSKSLFLPKLQASIRKQKCFVIAFQGASRIWCAVCNWLLYTNRPDQWIT